MVDAVHRDSTRPLAESPVTVKRLAGECRYEPRFAPVHTMPGLTATALLRSVNRPEIHPRTGTTSAWSVLTGVRTGC